MYLFHHSYPFSRVENGAGCFCVAIWNLKKKIFRPLNYHVTGCCVEQYASRLTRNARGML